MSILRRDSIDCDGTIAGIAGAIELILQRHGNPRATFEPLTARNLAGVEESVSPSGRVRIIGQYDIKKGFIRYRIELAPYIAPPKGE